MCLFSLQGNKKIMEKVELDIFSCLVDPFGFASFRYHILVLDFRLGS